MGTEGIFRQPDADAEVDFLRFFLKVPIYFYIMEISNYCFRQYPAFRKLCCQLAESMKGCYESAE